MVSPLCGVQGHLLLIESRRRSKLRSSWWTPRISGCGHRRGQCPRPQPWRLQWHWLPHVKQRGRAYRTGLRCTDNCGRIRDVMIVVVVYLIDNQLVVCHSRVAHGDEAGAGGEGHLLSNKCSGRGSVCRATLRSYSSRRFASRVGSWPLSS